MVSVAELINAQGGLQRRPVTVYSPGRRVPPAPTRRTNAPARQQGPATRVDWNAVLERGDLQGQAERRYQKKAEEEAWDKTPWYSKGLGMVLGNPIVSNLLVPLGAIGTLGRGVTYGVEALAESRAGDVLRNVPVGGVAPFFRMIDTERTEADERSFKEKVLDPSSDYGFGQLLDPDNPAWLNKITGLAGDVALDPTTYLTAGATRVAGAAARGAKVGRAATAATKADDAMRAMRAALEIGELDEVGRLGNLAVEQGAMARRLGEEVAGMPAGRRVPLRQGRKARAQFLGDIARENPDLYKKYSAELTRGAERGFNTIRDPVLREAIGLGDPAVRWLGMNIPKTGKIIEQGIRPLGGLRAAANKTPLGTAMGKFAPKGLEEPLAILTRGKPGDAFRAATATGIQNMMRRAAGNMEGRSNKMLTDLVRSWKGRSEEQVRALFRQAETDDAPNEINKFFGYDVPELYNEVAGRGMEVTRNKDTYVPHMHTPQGRRFLATLDKDVLDDMGFVQDDLLEGSKFLEKSRKLTPDTPGVPKEFQIGQRGTITLTDGTVDEINEELGRLFPEFKGKFYMDDPVKIGEAYISSISRQAGRDYAMDQIASSGNPLVHEVADELLASIETRNAYLRRNPVVEKVREGYTKGQRLVPAGPKGDMPVTPHDAMFAVTKHEAETQAQRQVMKKEGKQFVTDVAADVATTRSKISDTLKGLRSTLMDGLRKKERAAAGEIKAINRMLDDVGAEVKALGPLTSENVDELVGIHHGLDQKLVETRATRKKIQDRYGKQIPREQKAIQKELVAIEADIDRRIAEVEAQYDKGSQMMRAEAKQRKELLEEPIRQAEADVEAVVATFPRPVAKDRVQAANAHIRQDFDTEVAWEAERQRYIDAIHQMRAEGAPIRKRIDGRLHPETMEELTRRAKAMPPRVEAVTPPPTAAVPEAAAVSEAPLYPKGTPLDDITAGELKPEFIPAAEPPPVPTAAPAPPVAQWIEDELPSFTPGDRNDPRFWDTTRNVIDDGLIDVLDEQQLDQLEAISTLSNRDTEQFLGEMWDALPDTHKQRLRELGWTDPEAPEQLALPAAPAAPAPAAPAVVDRTIKRDLIGNFHTDDGFEIIKAGNEWHVMRHDGAEHYGAFPKIKDAKEILKLQQELSMLEEGGEELVEEAVEEVGEEVVEEVVEAPVEAAAPVAETKVPTPAPEKVTSAKPPRAPRGWKKKTVNDREIQVGPDGWQIEPFEASTRQHVDEVTGELVPAEAPRGTRYVAINSDPLKDNLRNRSFPTATDAKLAVDKVRKAPRSRTTLAEYAARGEQRPGGPPTEATFAELASQIPPRAPAGTPEQRAAQLAAVQAVPQKPPSVSAGQMPRPEYETVPSGTPEELAAYAEVQQASNKLAEAREAAPPGPPSRAVQYRKDYDAWQDMLARSEDMSLSQAERNKAKRTARSMGGEFTQTTGKWYQRHASEQIMMEDVAYEIMLLQDEDYLAAMRKLDKAKAEADNQVEAMVYVKAHDPILNQEVITRTPDTSMGFGIGEERIPVLPKPPTEGNVPTGGRVGPPQTREGGVLYDPATRARDRQLLDDPRAGVWIGENREKYDALVTRSEKISDRVEQADVNQTWIDELKAEADAAYTDSIRQADEAVLAAKAELERAKSYKAGVAEGNIPRVGGHLVNVGDMEEQAKFVLRNAENRRALIRGNWMRADRKYRAALAQRKEYLDLADDVTRAEQALIGQTKTADQIIEAINETGTIPESVVPEQGGRVTLSEDTHKVARRWMQAKAKRDAARFAGREFMTDTERRALVGEMVGVDLAKRDLWNQMAGESQDLLSGGDLRVQGMRDLDRGVMNVPREAGQMNLETPGPMNVPPVHGHEGLAGRAYAESFNPTQPAPKGVVEYGEKLVGKGGMATLQPEAAPIGRIPYRPRTEREAIGELEREAGTLESPLRAKVNEERRVLEDERAGEIAANERRRAEQKLLTEVERDENLLPVRDQVETLVKVNQALHDKEKLIPERNAAVVQRKQVVDAKVSNKVDLVETIDQIGEVARQNPDLLDDDMAVTEAVLQSARSDAEALGDKDLTVKQVQTMIDKAYDSSDNSLDIMLTTVGKNWRMLYEANGTKKPVLQAGDIIVDAELSRMFKNMYDMSKDRVLFGRTLNAFTNLFKTYATLTPGFHIRNALSAIFMNSTDGVALATQFKGAQIFREYMNAENGEKWLKELPGRQVHGIDGKLVQDAFIAAHGTGVGGRFTEAGFAEIANEGGIMERLERLQRNRFTRWSQRTGVRVEGSVRLAMALDSMILGEDIQSAIQRINRIHFDYAEISTLDENMKRLIPFWTFMSRNLPMQVSQMWTKPRVYQQYQDFVRNMSAENEEYTPEYWLKAGAFNTGAKVPDVPGLGGAQGLPVYLSPDLGFTRLQSDLKDYEEFLSGKRPGGVLSQVNPILSAPVEYLTRQDIFTGQRFEEGETVPVGGLNTPYKWLAGLLGQTEGGEVDAAFMNAIRAVNPLTDRSARLLPQLTGGDEEGNKRQLESWLRTMLGAPVRTLTPKQQDNEYYRRYYEQLDAQRQQQDRLQRQAG